MGALVGAMEPTNGFSEVLRVPAMSMGVFVASPGYDDHQPPHDEDEVYVVTSGTALLEIGGIREPVGPGSIAFVPAHVAHRFLHISEPVQVLVFFAPAQSRPAN